MNMSNKIAKKIALCLVCVLIALASSLIVSDWASSPETHQKAIASIDKKIEQVQGMTAACVATSALVTVLPDDIATPIADKLADIASYFLIVLSALYLEKYMLTIAGTAAFTVLIPAACALFLIGLFWNPERLNHIARKLGLFALAIFLLVPVSIKISDNIYEVYHIDIDASIQTSANSQSGTAIGQPAASSGGLISSLSADVQEKVNEYTQKLNIYLQNFAVMLVTSCIIPLLVMIFFLWVMRILLGVDLSMQLSKLSQSKIRNLTSED